MVYPNPLFIIFIIYVNPSFLGGLIKQAEGGVCKWLTSEQQFPGE